MSGLQALPGSMVGKIKSEEWIVRERKCAGCFTSLHIVYDQKFDETWIGLMMWNETQSCMSNLTLSEKGAKVKEKKSMAFRGRAVIGCSRVM
jgi:hypothetical protein